MDNKCQKDVTVGYYGGEEDNYPWTIVGFRSIIPSV